jgi:hypothetical protein
MRFFALLTGALVLVLAVLVVALPSADTYVRGVDDGPPERFKTIADAERAVGFDFPDAGTPRGWDLEDVTVTPAYYVRRLLADNPALIARPLPNQGDNTNALLWRHIPDPRPGVHNYVSIVYTSDIGFISLNINYPISNRAPAALTSEAVETARRTVVIGDQRTTLSSYKSRDIEAMFVAWQVKQVPVRATAFTSPNDLYRITADEFVAFLANVR